MRPRPLVRLQALLLAALVGALTSGVPSHHHAESDLRPVLADADHHGHGVQLVDQSERLTSQMIAVALPSAPTLRLGEDLPTTDLTFQPARQPVIGGRPPPTDQPRAPPVSV